MTNEPENWVKLHRRTLENKIFRHDRTAWHLFEVLLLLVNRNNGEWSGGIFQLAELAGLSKGTAYSALMRLEKEQMVKRSSNARFSTYYICKWPIYQSAISENVKRSSNARQTLVNTLTRNRVKNKEIYIPNGNVEQVRQVYEHFIKEFARNENTYKLSDMRKAKIKVRLKDAGTDMLLKAITNTANSPFHQGENNRGWKADLDFIIRSYEQVERLSQLTPKPKKDVPAIQPRIFIKTITDEERAKAREKINTVRQQLIDKHVI